jgi:hypothetical protein
MPFHIQKKHPSAGTLYYAGNYQWHKDRDNRLVYGTEDGARVECNHVRGTIVEETE